TFGASAGVIGTRIGFSCQVSPAPIGMSWVCDQTPFLCTNQSCTWNWIHAAAMTLRIFAGWNVVRVRSSRLTRRGFGVIRLATSGKVSLNGTLRPKRVPALPMRGQRRSLLMPSLVRTFTGSPLGAAVCSSAGSSVSCRFFARSSLRISTSLTAAAGPGSSCHSLSETKDIGRLLGDAHSPTTRVDCFFDRLRGGSAAKGKRYRRGASVSNAFAHTNSGARAYRFELARCADEMFRFEHRVHRGQRARQALAGEARGDRGELNSSRDGFAGFACGTHALRGGD